MPGSGPGPSRLPRGPSRRRSAANDINRETVHWQSIAAQCLTPDPVLLRLRPRVGVRAAMSPSPTRPAARSAWPAGPTGTESRFWLSRRPVDGRADVGSGGPRWAPTTVAAELFRLDGLGVLFAEQQRGTRVQPVRDRACAGRWVSPHPCTGGPWTAHPGLGRPGGAGPVCALRSPRTCRPAAGTVCGGPLVGFSVTVSVVAVVAGR